MIQLRIYYSKLTPMQYTSTLDMQLVWERTLRRAGLPLAYSQGYHPQPRMQQALPLPLGMTSIDEMLDVWLESELTLPKIEEKIIKALNPGMEIHNLEQIFHKSPSITTQVVASSYFVTPMDNIDLRILQQRITELLNSTHIIRSRRDKEYDIRPLIEELYIMPGEVKKPGIFMKLSAKAGATGRPEEVIACLGFDPLVFAYTRQKIFLVQ